MLTEGVVVDFCAGGGHVGLLVAHLHPSVTVHLVENKEESLANAAQRISTLNLSNVKLFQVWSPHCIPSIVVVEPIRWTLTLVRFMNF